MSDASAGTTAPTGTSATPKRGTLTLLSLAQFMVVLDFTIVNVALPSIQSSLGMTTSSVQWVISAYSVAFGGFLLLGGRLADDFGRRRMFVLGLVIFSAGSLLGAAAPTGAVLVASRVVQGLGAAVLAPAGLSLLVVEYPAGAARARAIGVFASIVTVGFAAGAVAGGLLVAVGSWRLVFVVNVLVGTVALVATPRILTPDPHTASGSLDVAGAAFVTAGMAALVFAAVEIGDGAVRGGLVLLAAGAVLLAVFVGIESRVASPLVPLSLFRNRLVTGANLSTLIAGAVTAGELLVVTLYLQQGRGWSALATGLAFLPQAATAYALSTVASKVILRLGTRVTLLASMVLAAGTVAVMAWAAAGGSIVLLLVGAAVLGVANRFAMVASTLAGTQVPNADEGLASALLSATRQCGSAFGVAVLVAVIAAAGGIHASSSARDALLTAAALALVGGILSAAVVPAGTPSTPGAASAPPASAGAAVAAAQH